MANPPLSPYPNLQAKLRDDIVYYMQENNLAKGMATQYFPVLAESIAYAVLNNLQQLSLNVSPPTLLDPAAVSSVIG
jgi:hypothetical protein